MKISFEKLSATGNDFVVIDHREQFVRDDSIAEFVRVLCAYHTGIGADGLLLLEDHDETDFRMRYYNGDGSHATMCGNGARALSWFARRLGLWSDAAQFIADDGLHRAEYHDGMIGVSLNIDSDYRAVDLEDQDHSWSIHTGVPHLVIFSENLADEDVYELGKKYRWDKRFQPEGTNVNFVKVEKESIRVRTYERGVENETLACGTGVMASAVISGLEAGLKFPLSVSVAGGNLKVTQQDEEWILWGTVDRVYTGMYLLETEIESFLK